MKQLTSTHARPYPICITNDWNGLSDNIKKVSTPSSIYIITDNNVAAFYLKDIEKQIASIAPVSSYIFEAGEKSKNLQTICAIYDDLLEKQMDRTSLIIALGGGVVGDLAGFVAATFMRGIPFIQIPTTVVAQNDSSIGGKVGVDYKDYKNMIGAFYHPKLVFININVLQTLPKREFSAGMAEVIKHGYILPTVLLTYLQMHVEQIMHMDEETLLEMTYLSVNTKCHFVEKDPKEKNIRKILNFGHTFGHALETCSQFTLLHGECVAYGMCIVNHIALKRKYINQEVLKETIMLCKQYGLLNKVPFQLNLDNIQSNIYLDKKKEGKKVGFILLKALQDPNIIYDVTQQEIEKAVKYFSFF